MYLHLGGDSIIPLASVVAIIDIEDDESKITKQFYEKSREQGDIEFIDDEEYAKSMIVTDKKIFISPISAATLKKRSENFLDSDVEEEEGEIS